jgi:hypothetical protein
MFACHIRLPSVGAETSHAFPLQVFEPFDELVERHRRLVRPWQEARVVPLAAAVSPATVNPLEDVVAGLSVLDVVGGVGLHLGTKPVRLREPVVDVGVADACNDFDFLVRRDLSTPRRESALVGVDDDTESIVPIRVRIREERDSQGGRELSLVRADVVTGFPRLSGVPPV